MLLGLPLEWSILSVWVIDVPTLRTCVFITLLLSAFAVSAEVFRWTDANGNTVFGDSPPEATRAQSVELPLLTVADGFGKKKTEEPASAVATETVEDADKTDTATSDETSQAYTHFSIQSPSADDAIRANNGTLEVTLDIRPPLHNGHGIVLYLDGKQVANTRTSTVSINNVDRGQHSVFAVLHDAKDSVLTNTEAVNFSLLRASKK